MTLIEKLQANPQLLAKIEKQVEEIDITDRVNRIWAARGFTKGRMVKYQQAFLSNILQADSSLTSAIEFLTAIEKNNPAIPASIFGENFDKSFVDIVPPAIKSNETFLAIYESMLFGDMFRGKGIGPGEFILALLGERGNIVDAQGDVMIGNHGIEIKGGMGSVKTGSPASFRKSDNLRAWVAKQVGLDSEMFGRKSEGKIKLVWHAEGPFAEAFNKLDPSKKKEITTEYVKQLYPKVSPEYQSHIADGLAKHAGTPNVTSYFGEALLSTYMDHDKFGSIMILAPPGRMLNIADTKNLPPTLKVDLAGVNRDGDTQAVPDGFINISIAKPPRKRKGA